MGNAGKGSSCAAALLCLLAATFSPAAAADPPPPSGQPATVVKDGVTEWRLYLPQKAGVVERFAAAELRKYVSRMTGVSLKETTEAGPRTIRVGLRANVDDGSLPPAKPGFDGYSIAVTANQIVLAGDNPRGTLYAVYDLLERAGCRWWQPTLDPKDPEVVPKRTEVTFGEGWWSEASPIELRTYNGAAFFFWIHCDRIVPQMDWAAKNRFNVVGWQPSHEPESMQNDMEKMRECGALAEMEKRGLELHGPFHSFPFFLPAEKYFASHPDWFGMVNGARRPYRQEFVLMNHCWSNAEANAEFIRNVEAFVKQWPQIKILNVTTIDGAMTCQCPKCLEAGSTGLLVDHFNHLADRLEKVAPDVRLETVVGYEPLVAPPKLGGPVPNGKWQVLYAHWGRSHLNSYADLDYPRRPNMLAWRSYVPKFDVCSYYGAADHEPWDGAPFLHALEGDTKFVVETGAVGHYILDYPYGFWWNMSFSMGEAGKYAYYYPARTPEAELRDYAMTYFGEQAGPLVFEYFQMLGVNENLQKSYRVCQADGGKNDMDWFHDMEELRQRAAGLASGDPVVSYRLAKLGAAPEFLSTYGTLRWRVGEAERAYNRMRLTKTGDGDVRGLLRGVRDLLVQLAAKAKDLEARYPGTMAAEWMKDWSLERGFAGQLHALEKKLDAPQQAPAPASRPAGAGLQ